MIVRLAVVVSINSSGGLLSMTARGQPIAYQTTSHSFLYTRKSELIPVFVLLYPE